MRNAILLFLLPVVLLATACGGDSTIPPAAAASVDTIVKLDTAALIVAMQKSAADWNKGDLAGFMGFYDGSATMMSRHGLIGTDSMMAHYQQTYFKDGAPKQQLSFDQLKVTPLAGDYALLTGRFTLSGGGLPTLSGWYSLVCVQRKTGWKILHDHSS